MVVGGTGGSWNDLNRSKNVEISYLEENKGVLYF